MIRLQLSILAGALLVVLGGCTSYQVSGSIPLSRQHVSEAIAFQNPLGGPQLRATLPDAGLSGVFIQQTTNGGYSFWRAPDQSALVLWKGFLSSTYSLGFDLYSADVTETSRLISLRQSGKATRVHRYLDGENQIVVRAFRCTVSIAESAPGLYQATEECQGADTEFVNTYEANRSGSILRSLQWVGPEVGYIQLTQLSSGQSNRNDLIAIVN